MTQIEKFRKLSKILRAKLLTLVLVLLIFSTSARADDTTIIATSSAGNPDSSLHPSLVFISRDVGFKLSLIGDEIHSYRTTDSGITWTDQGNVGGAADTFQGGPTVWYDDWTPGDNGNKVYFTAVNNTGYNQDPLLVMYSVNSSGVLSYINNRSLAQHNVNVITRTTVAKNTDGMLHSSYMKDPYRDGNENGESNRIWTNRNSGGTNLYTDAGITFLDNDTYRTGDDIMIRPLGTAKSIAFVWDISDNNIYYSIYTPNANPANFGTWSPRTFLASAIDSGTHRSAWAAVTNKTTREVYFTFNTNVANSSGQLKTYIFNGNTATLGVTAKANITGGTVYEVDLAIDNNTGNVYTIFTTPGSPRHFNAFISTDKMDSWQNLESTGDFDAYVADRNYAGISLNQSSSHIIGAALRNDSESGRIYFVKLADLVPAAVCDIPNSLSITRADTLIDNNVNQYEERHRSPSVVFVSKTVGYMFSMAVEGDKKPFYRKTTNGGLTWGPRVNISTTNDCDGVTVWYDKWTPGNAGSLIHFVYNHDGQNRLYYGSLNTANDALTTPVAITTSSGSIATHYLSGYSITKGYDGYLYASLTNYYTANTIPMVRCNTNCNSAGNWSAVAAYPSGLVGTSYTYNSEFKLAPLSGNRILALFRNDHANTITYSIYNSSTGTWIGTGTLETGTTESNTYKNAWGLTVDSASKDVYLCYNNRVNNSGGVIKTAVFNSSGFVAGSLRSVYGGESGQCDLAYNEHTREVILLRNQVLDNNLNRITAAKSKDQMQSWSPSRTVSLTHRNYRAAGMNFSSDAKIYAWYYDDSANDIYGNTILNIDSSRDALFEKQSVADWLHFN